MSMSDFTPGQRGLSESETELGLGIIKELDYRLVTVEYPAVEEERTYAINNAPLSRVTFDVGDTIRTGDELELTVAEVNELNGHQLFFSAYGSKQHRIFMWMKQRWLPNVAPTFSDE